MLVHDIAVPVKVLFRYGREKYLYSLYSGRSSFVNSWTLK